MDRQALLKQALAHAAKYCSGRERAPIQVFNKLTSWELSEEEASSIIEDLKKQGFLDEERFCRAFCHDKFEFNSWGKIRIKMELRRLELPESTMEEGLASIPDDRYLQVIHNLAERKLTGLKQEANSFIKNQKTAAYLARKGFEPNLIWEVINDMSER